MTSDAFTLLLLCAAKDDDDDTRRASQLETNGSLELVIQKKPIGIGPPSIRTKGGPSIMPSPGGALRNINSGYLFAAKLLLSSRGKFD